MNTMKVLFYIVLLGLITSAGIAYYMYNKPHKDISKVKADYKMTVDQLYDEYESNEQKSNEKYLDKVIEVKGLIEEVNMNDSQKPTIILGAANALMGGASATLSEAYAKQAKDLKAGAETQLKCRCTGKLMDVVLIDCSILN